MTHDTTPMYFEAVEIKPNQTFTEEDCIKRDGKYYFMTPPPLVSEISDEWITQHCIFATREYNNCVRTSMKKVIDKLAPTIAVLKARVKELENYVHTDNTQVILNLEKQLADQKSKERERAIGILKWFKENFGHGFDPQKMYDTYLASLTKQSEGK